ncbi:(d)CMP kinase [Paenibacillus hemerocallicola]|uniref:Cytidylate kinase n=1 Tax=Paenibacillus hemerocallicola TaxID=1172614 RepID=A0A5C4TE86_9BACL|nr:(d)CMP kinase [Paenibacillus hemerocallicola]TNJ67424.1 (d)CMP kinase [Paenibacillus hemerocallicola]
MEKFNIAIDGPAAAGKSTVARLVAKQLGFVYVDTGAMYRAVTWKALQSGISPERKEQLSRMASELRIELLPGEQSQQVLLDGGDVTDLIRSAMVNKNVSAVSAIPEIRRLLVAKQQEMAQAKGVVMDGRDIGTHVLPDAELKIFLTASVKERAQRRFLEMKAKGEDVTLGQLEKEIAERDKMDEQREASPLVQAEDAVLVDTSGMSIPQVAERILELAKSAASKGIR